MTNKGATGYLNISDGGKFSTNQGLWLGSRGVDTTKGFVDVRGLGSELSVDQRFIVGTWNYGAAVISDGATLTVKDTGTSAITVDNAVENQNDNLLVITGDNTTATAVNGGVVEANVGRGTLIIADNATLSAAKRIIIASDSTGNGELAIGNRKGKQATAAEQINADTIKFGTGKGVLVFNHTNTDYTLNAAISGKGTVEALSGTTILTGANSYTGNTLIGSSAILQAGAVNTFSSNSSYATKANGGLFLNGYNQKILTLNNKGSTSLLVTEAGTVLTITGNYTGENGYLILGTALGDDSSITDKLVIEGNATGTTHVTVQYLGGYGAQTIEGIKVIEVQGTSEEGAFVQNGRIVAGAYDYSLVKGFATNQDEQSWYLTSIYNETNTGDNTNNIHVIRPEAMAYLSNSSMANNIFGLRLQERQPERTYIDHVTGQKQIITLWLRHQYGHNQFEDATGTLNSKANRNTIQLGGDIIQFSGNGNDRFHIGLMAGSGYAHGHAEFKLSKYYARTELTGYSLGLYGTWYQNNADKMGLYIDTWALWNNFTAKVNGQTLAQEKYHLQGMTSSIEMGYTLNLKQLSPNYQLWLQSQTQITWQGVKANNHTETNGVQVKGNKNNIHTRLGARIMLVPIQTSDSTLPMTTTYLETNWLHNTKNYRVNLADQGISLAGTKNIAEVRIGVEGNITDHTGLWFNVGHQFSNNGYRDTTLGVKYSF